MSDFAELIKVKKNLINLLVLAILVLALPIGINLIKQQQILRSRAAAVPITVEGSCITNRNGKLVATCPQVTVKLVSPLGGPTVSSSASPSPTPSPSGGIQLTVVPTNGTTVTIAWSGIPNPSSKDWVGFYLSGTTGASGWKDWVYTNSCTKTAGSASSASGNCTYTLPSASFSSGNYVARLFSNNGNNQIGQDVNFSL